MLRAKELGCVLLASGNKDIFGNNNLLARFRGKTLIDNVFDATPPHLFTRISVVTDSEEIGKRAAGCGYDSVHNAHPEYGLGHTIQLGLSAMDLTGACMFIMCNRPDISKYAVSEMAGAYVGGIAVIGGSGGLQSPVIFPKSLYGELLFLKQGQSYMDVIDRHRQLVVAYNIERPNNLPRIKRHEDNKHLDSIKNFFVVGSKDSGKTTLLGFAIDLAGTPVTGFLTRPYDIEGHKAGHYMHSLSPLTDNGHNDKAISVRIDANVSIPVVRTFDYFGSMYLERALDDGMPVILMDELGAIEQQAGRFTAAIEKCLDSDKPVIGSMMDAPAEWLARIKERDDTLVRNVSEANRDDVLNEALYFLRKHKKLFEQK